MDTTYQHIPYLVAIVDSTHVRSAATSFKNLLIVVQENSTNQTDVLVDEQLQPPSDLVTVIQEQELHKPNSRTEWLIIQQVQSLPNSNYNTACELA